MKKKTKFVMQLSIAIGIPLIFALLFIREWIGGAYLNRYPSPNHPGNVVEMYVGEGFIGSPEFSLYVVDAGHRQYLGKLCYDSSGFDGIFSPWSDQLSWSRDGTVLYCRDQGCRAAYIFGEQEIFMRAGLPQGEGTKPAATVAEVDIAALVRQHGGGQDCFFTDWKETASNFIWYDFLPSEIK